MAIRNSSGWCKYKSKLLVDIDYMKQKLEKQINQEFVEIKVVASISVMAMTKPKYNVW